MSNFRILGDILRTILRYSGDHLRYQFIGGAVIAIVLGVLVFRDTRSIRKHMERESPALIAALNAFKERKGAYPEKLEQLVPDYIDSLPSCSSTRVKPIPYQRHDIGGGYTLTCYTDFFRTGYDSASGKWF